MTTFTARFDGKVLIPDQNVDLPEGVPLQVSVDVSLVQGSALERLAALAEKYPDSGLPSDGAAQHDHYLYGVPKHP